jgi:predicted CopG family antitoxin
MTEKSDPYSIKAITKLARSPAIKEIAKLIQTPAMCQTMRAVESMRPSIAAAISAVQDAERAKHLNELVRGLMKKPIGEAIKEIQAEIDKDCPLTGRQILFLMMEKSGVSVSDVVRKLAEIGEQVKEAGKKGQETAYGSKVIKNETRKKWQSLVEAQIKATPTLSFEEIKKRVAKDKKNNVSIHQLKRYTIDTRKK